MNAIFTDVNTLITAIASVFMVFVVIIIYLKKRKTKKLAYIKSVNDLHSQDFNGDLNFTYRNHSMKDLYFITLTIINMGNVAIKKKDYEFPLSIELEGDGKILNGAVRIIKTNPPGLEKKLPRMYSADVKKITLRSVLLNPGNYIKLRFIANPYKGLKLNGQIKDIREIKEKQDIKNLLKAISIYPVNLIFILVFISYLILFVWSIFNFLILQFILSGVFMTGFAGWWIYKLIEKHRR